jgi:hypothetical protein
MVFLAAAEVGMDAARILLFADMAVCGPSSFFSSSMIEASIGEDLRLLDWFTLRPSISMLPLFENSMLFVDRSSPKPPEGILMSNDTPSKPELALFVSWTVSFPVTIGIDRSMFSDDHFLFSSMLSSLIRSGALFTRIWGMLAAADVKLLTVGAFVLRLV